MKYCSTVQSSVCVCLLLQFCSATIWDQWLLCGVRFVWLWNNTVTFGACFGITGTSDSNWADRAWRWNVSLDTCWQLLTQDGRSVGSWVHCCWLSHASSFVFCRLNGIVCWSRTQQCAVCCIVCVVLAVRSVLQVPAYWWRKDLAPPAICSHDVSSTRRTGPTRRHTTQVAAEFVSNRGSSDVHLAAVSYPKVDIKFSTIFHCPVSKAYSTLDMLMCMLIHRCLWQLLNVDISTLLGWSVILLFEE